MLGGVFKHILVGTSISPVFLAIWIRGAIETKSPTHGLYWLFLFTFLIPTSWIIIRLSERKLEILPIKVNSVSLSDKEVSAFLVAYILPILSIVSLDLWTVLFIIFLLYVSMLTTGNYHFNPVLSLLFGYHYYEIEIEIEESKGETITFVTFVLMTKKTIKSARNIKKVVQVSDYMLLEVSS